jgi:putative Mg2+ transporter-C (MgtC) family protein
VTSLSGALTQGAWAIYWSGPELAINIIVSLHLLAALVLGMLVGYERFYHGRAVGMRTYGLVCMASAGLIVILGYPDSWYGGQITEVASPDPTRVIQGIVTGIGFLGAGVIVHERFSTRGLTTAASIWASSAIGIMLGMGFFPTALLLTVLSIACMALVRKIENALPSQQKIAVTLRLHKGASFRPGSLKNSAAALGYTVTSSSLSFVLNETGTEWHFVATVAGTDAEGAIAELSETLSSLEGAIGFELASARS